VRVLDRFSLRPGFEEEYRRRHNEIWPDMLDLMREAGIRNYSIWNDGTELIGYFETDDLDQCRCVLRESPVKKRWDEYMSDILVFNEHGKMTPLDLMFEIN